ncbi:hypothetical protein LZZ85_02690 [Terrimonas sp. NA20]|uniref:Uncharacterized protein n=1 Tax=Terrimonas ginsenosidimutans TaxID=2908004 RepID=A0ABS9KLF9_9BACT|nr:hypothetical protein [Terrimonas ginsenosidimutans]MCG2613163.1 hypothetical protein [Terrimonas ginsenosidimutans]
MLELESAIFFTFKSLGREKIPKIIEYSLISRTEEFDIFNLGFGTYNKFERKVLDGEVSNNGDVFKVFNTILSSIPLFFSLEPNALLMISGSDSGEQYVSRCRISCTKNCDGLCRNENRRINIYKKYVEKNYDSLSGAYRFFGSRFSWDEQMTFEPFQIGISYRSIFIKKI